MSRSWVFNQTMFRGSESPSVAPRPSAFVKLFRDISRDIPGISTHGVLELESTSQSSEATGPRIPIRVMKRC